MRKFRKIIITAVIGLGSLLTAVLAYPWIEPARWLHDIHGIDVSHHQGPIDWNAVAADGVSFAFIKATAGGDFTDPRFVENWRGAAKAGIPRGAYHFFTQCRSGELQAQNFIRTVPRDSVLRDGVPRSKRALAHVIDAEHMGPCRKQAQVPDVVAEILTFLYRLEQYYGRRPIIYTTREFHDTYLRGRLTKEKFWIRSLVIPPTVRRADWVVWQYHNRGRRNGITGPVDLNVMRPANSRRPGSALRPGSGT